MAAEAAIPLSLGCVAVPALLPWVGNEVLHHSHAGCRLGGPYLCPFLLHSLHRGVESFPIPLVAKLAAERHLPTAFSVDGVISLYDTKGTDCTAHLPPVGSPGREQAATPLPQTLLQPQHQKSTVPMTSVGAEGAVSVDQHLRR